MEGLSNFRYVPSRPLSDKTLNNFSSLVQIGCQVPANAVMLPNKSYLSVKFRVAACIAANTSLNPLAVNIPNNDDTAPTTSLALSSNPVACLFNKASVRLQDTTVSSVEEYAGLCQMTTFTSETKSTLDTVMSTEPSYVFGQKRLDPFGTTGAVAYNPSIDYWGNTTSYRISKHSKWGQVGMAAPWGLSTRFRLAHRPCLSIFQSEQHLPPGSNLLLQLNVDNNWRNRVISGIRGNGNAGPAGINTSWTVNGTFPPVAANTVAIEIQDIVLMTCLVDVNLSIPKSISVRYTQFFSTTQALNQSSQQNLQFRLPPGTEAIYLAFYNGLTGTNTFNAPTDFSVNDILLNLQQIDIISGGVSYPYTYYNILQFVGYQGTPSAFPVVNGEQQTILLQASSSTSNIINRTNVQTYADTDTVDLDDVTRAYMDYLNGTDSTVEATGAPMSLIEWMYNPIFAHKLVTPAGDRTQDISVRLKFRVGLQTSNVQMLLVAKYASMVNMNFTDHGTLDSVSVDNLI
jgi:hypothetical protein